MNRLLPTLVYAIAFALAGCASGPPPKPNFLESPNQTLAPPPADKAQIVFLEPINTVQGMIPVALYKVEGEQRQLLAITGAHSKAAVLLEPGRHRLAAAQFGGSHFLEANVEAGKRYYVLLRFIYANGFQLRPLRTSGPSDYTVNHKDFPSWVSESKFVEMTPEGKTLFETTYKDLMSTALANGWKNFQAKTPQERAELTLNPEDAVSK